jgi:glycerol-3-phosphate dehydrogenase
MRIAPSLIHPLKVLIPTYGHGLRGREAFTIAVALNELISFDRNRLEDPEKQIPTGKTISRAECLQCLPGLPGDGVTGGTVFYDAQVYNSERLVLAFIQSACLRGAQAANYTEVTGFLLERGRVIGVQVADHLDGERFDVRARLVINASGPWINQVLASLDGGRVHLATRISKAINLVTRTLFPGLAAGIRGENGYLEGKPLAERSQAYLFVAPWRDRSIIGTGYTFYDKPVDEFTVDEQDIGFLLGEVNRVYPAGKLQRDEITFVHSGMLPVADKPGNNAAAMLKKHYTIVDHRRDGFPGLFSVEGVKYTTARDVAVRVVDQAFAGWGHRPPPSASAVTRLVGGEIERFGDFLQRALDEQPCGLEPQSIRSLVYNYGSAYQQVLGYLARTGGDGGGLPGGELPDGELPLDLALLRAEVLYSVANEMAYKLGDVVFRRTELGSAGDPGGRQLEFSARVMGQALGWSPERVRREIEAVWQVYLPAG